MAETKVKPKMTEEEFLHLPDDGRKYELVNGKAIEVPAGIEREAIAAHLIDLFTPLVKGIGVLCAFSAGYWMVTGNIRSPDVSFIRKERLPEGKLPKGFADFPHDLAIKIVFPNEDWAEMGRKLQVRGVFCDIGL